jgi:hypothetical protein
MTALKNLTALLVLSFLASGVLGWFLFQSHSDLEAARTELEHVKTEHADELKAKEAEFQRTLDTQAAQHQKMITALNDEHEKKIDELRQGERSRLATAAKEFENIFEGNKTTLGYINSLEDKVKAGQALSKAEVEKLTIITTGLGYLKKQYQKPMQEFTGAAAYFEAQASKVTREAQRAASSSACSARSSASRKRNTPARKVPRRPSSRRRTSSRRSIPARRKPWAP